MFPTSEEKVKHRAGRHNIHQEVTVAPIALLSNDRSDPYWDLNLSPQQYISWMGIELVNMVREGKSHPDSARCNSSPYCQDYLLINSFDAAVKEFATEPRKSV